MYLNHSLRLGLKVWQVVFGVSLPHHIYCRRSGVVVMAGYAKISGTHFYVTQIKLQSNYEDCGDYVGPKRFRPQVVGVRLRAHSGGKAEEVAALACVAQMIKEFAYFGPLCDLEGDLAGAVMEGESREEVIARHPWGDCDCDGYADGIINA